MPGWGRRSAQDAVAETGAGMTKFPTGGHLSSSGGKTPLDHQSGKRAGRARHTKGHEYLAAVTGETAVPHQPCNWAGSRHLACADSIDLEGHRDTGGPGAGALGDPLTRPHGREGGLDRVGGPQVDPVLGRIVVELEQRVQVLGDLRDGPWEREVGFHPPQERRAPPRVTGSAVATS